MHAGGQHASTLPDGDGHDVAEALSSALLEACEGRLSPVEWFRSTHQRGGAATGFSTWKSASGSIPVMVKLPVGEVEHRWTTGLGACSVESWGERWSRAIPTPRVVAAGRELGGFGVPWFVVEKLSGPALSSRLGEGAALELLAAAADFQAAAMRAAPLVAPPPSPDWDHAIDHARQLARAGSVPESQRWNDALKKVQRALPRLAARWNARPINAWCHGDLHPGNALKRVATDPHPDRCVLVDLALVHTGHWLEDAVYFERQFWGHEDVINGLKPVPTLARLRRERGLPADDNYGDLALVRRVLMAACAPQAIEREGNLKYLHAALAVIERFLPQAAH